MALRLRALTLADREMRVEMRRLRGYWARFALGVLLVGAMNFIIGSLAVRMKTILGLLRAKFYVQELLSGLLVPMTMFPAAIAGALEWLPFQHIAYTPLRIYLGKLGTAELAQALAVQWAWAAALLAGGSLFWRWMAKRLTVQGG